MAQVAAEVALDGDWTEIIDADVAATVTVQALGRAVEIQTHTTTPTQGGFLVLPNQILKFTVPAADKVFVRSQSGLSTEARYSYEGV